jgi:hypothetical protein
MLIEKPYIHFFPSEKVEAKKVAPTKKVKILFLFNGFIG